MNVFVSFQGFPLWGNCRGTRLMRGRMRSIRYFKINLLLYNAHMGLPLATGRRGTPTSFITQEMPNFYHLLPEEIQKFTVGRDYDPLNHQESI